MDQLTPILQPEILEPIDRNLPEAVEKKFPPYMPKEERPEYRKMYEYYAKMGHKRSLRKVAKEFSRSVQNLSVISRRFGWVERVKLFDSVYSDPVTNIIKPQMDGARRDIVNVVSEVTLVLAEMTELSKKIRKNGIDQLESKDKKKMNSLINALSVYGLRIRTPKDLRDMIGTLKDVMEFNKGVAPTPPAAGAHATQFNVKEMNLIIQDED